MIERIERELDLLDRHVDVLRQVIDAEPTGIRSISKELDFPEHQARYSLRKLEVNDLVVPTRFGAVTTDRADATVLEINRHFSDLGRRMDRLREEFVRAPQ